MLYLIYIIQGQNKWGEGMNKTDKIFKELETHLETRLKQKRGELLKNVKEDKEYIIKDLTRRGKEWLSDKLEIDFYKISSGKKKKYEDKLIHIIHTIIVRNTDLTTDEIEDMFEELSVDKKIFMTTGQKIVLILYFFVCVSIITYLLMSTWPSTESTSDPGKVEYLHGILTVSMHMEIRVLVLVFLAGALGGFIHYGTSFMDFAGKTELKKAFIIWYIMRPILGAILAVVFYLVFRGYLFTSTPDDYNLYGVVGFAALAGMFHKQAISWLKEAADSLFKKVENIEKGEKAEVDKLEDLYAMLLVILGTDGESGKVDKKIVNEGLNKLSEIFDEFDKEGGLSVKWLRKELRKTIKEFTDDSGKVDLAAVGKIIDGLIKVKKE